ncbi:MAG: FecR domain-containing protein [Candidatus Gracilibacteria bacterium]|nr:FecR domain-containing protein [Candidatus Gracilibacteria bacterium]
MKILKSKLSILILVIIFVIFGLQFFSVSNSYKRDINSYVTLTKGDGTLCVKGDCLNNKKILKLDFKEKIFNGDIINILDNSFAVIEWGDKSITRLGSNTKIEIKDNFISQDLSKINISFNLLKGKTWSNIVSMLVGDSSFKEEINGVSAAVRGTVFEANYEEQYVIVHNHEVELTNSSGNILELYTGQTFSIKDFSIDKIKVKIDEAFTKLNQNLDKEYLNKLKQELLNSIKNGEYFKSIFGNDNKLIDIITSGDKQELEKYISGLSIDKKQELIDKLKTFNQSLNFVNGEDSYLYKLKLKARSSLLNNVNNEQYKQTLLKYSIYDLNDIFSLKNFNLDNFKDSLNLIKENKDYINTFKDKILKNESIKNLLDKLLLLNNNFSTTSLNKIINGINSEGQNIINNGLNKILDSVKNK